MSIPWSCVIACAFIYLFIFWITSSLLPLLSFILYFLRQSSSGISDVVILFFFFFFRVCFPNDLTFVTDYLRGLFMNWLSSHSRSLLFLSRSLSRYCIRAGPASGPINSLSTLTSCLLRPSVKHYAAYAHAHTFTHTHTYTLNYCWVWIRFMDRCMLSNAAGWHL